MELKYFERYIILSGEEVDFHTGLRALVKELDPTVMILSVYDRLSMADYLNRLPRNTCLPLAVIVDPTSKMLVESDLPPLHFSKTYNDLNTIFVSQQRPETGAADTEKNYYFLRYKSENQDVDSAHLTDLVREFLRSSPQIKLDEEATVFRRKS